MKKLMLIALLLLLPAFIIAQDAKPADRHVFTKVYDLKATPVKNQGGTGTCWSFATTSFLESELLRMGKGEFDLSEIFFARNAYVSKTEQLIRLGGKNNFGQGGQAHDVIDVIREKGIMPEEAYSGILPGEMGHNHGELENAVSSLAQGIAKKPGRNLTPRWRNAVDGVIDAFIGKAPEKFTYKGKEYTAKSFAKELGLNPDDYIELTSFANFPFNTKVHLSVPDNWSHAQYYNVSIDDLMKIMEYALKNGYTVDWDGDVSEKEFNKGNANYSVVPADSKDTDTSKPEKEKTITDAMRLESFDKFQTTDDHLMHITGMATNQEGTKFWLTKNSWGPVGKYGGYWYMSDAYARYKVVAILVHKNAIPNDIKSNLGIK